MRNKIRLTLLIALTAATVAACSREQGATPTSPSPSPVPLNAASEPETANGTSDITSSLSDGRVLDWRCFSEAANGTPTATGSWTVVSTSQRSCAASAPLSVGAAAVTIAPGNFRATVTGTTVRLDWNPIFETVVSYLIEAGSFPGAANLARLNTGNSIPSLTVTNVPSGEYYVRVRGVGPDNIPGPASNETVVRVNIGCVPGAPSALASTVNGSQVNLTWTAPPPGVGCPPTSYLIEAGSGSALANLAVIDTGNPGTSLSANAPNGTYYVRIRGRNANGVGAASNEIVVAVGTEQLPQQLPPPPAPLNVLVPAVTPIDVPVLAPPEIVPAPAPDPVSGGGPVVGVAPGPIASDGTVEVTVTSSTTPYDELIVTTAGEAPPGPPQDRAVAASHVGGTSHYRIRFSTTTRSARIRLRTQGPNFTLLFGARLGSGVPGNYATTPVARGGGALRVTLSWDTTADIDLYVVEPNGTTVYYGNRQGPTARLDVDDVDGYGPENVFVAQGAAASGVYQVYVRHFSGVAPTNATINIALNTGTSSERRYTFHRTLGSRQGANVADVNIHAGTVVERTGARDVGERDLPAKPYATR